jgi:hypothetical protein
VGDPLKNRKPMGSGFYEKIIMSNSGTFGDFWHIKKFENHCSIRNSRINHFWQQLEKMKEAKYLKKESLVTLL